MRVITETDLRAKYSKSQDKEIYLNKDDFLTQTAKDYIKERKMTVLYDETTDYELMTKEPIDEGPLYKYFDSHGIGYKNKPEHMTHLHGNILVLKNHPRIIFRGKLDTLQGKILMAQVLASKEGKNQVLNDLDDILKLARKILASEVKEEPLQDQLILGLDEEALRERSHNPDKYYRIQHFVANYKMGELVTCLNLVRTSVRETELSAINAFTKLDGEIERPDLVRMLNRMSSGVYIIICKILSSS